MTDTTHESWKGRLVGFELGAIRTPEPLAVLDLLHPGDPLHGCGGVRLHGHVIDEYDHAGGSVVLIECDEAHVRCVLPRADVEPVD